jgi:3-keto-5-aminohexanoate cleavage enzyme
VAVDSPLIIEVRANEAADRGDNPALPYGPQEVLTELLAAHEAGASILHWHARADDGTEHADDVALHRAVVEGIRREAPEAIVHPTLGFLSTQGDAQGRMRHILELMKDPATRIDVVPVDVGAYGADVWDARAGHFATDDRFVTNGTAYLRELLDVIGEHDLSVYPVVWSAGAVRTARRLQEEGRLRRPTLWCLGFTGDEVPGGPPPTPANLRTFLDELPPGAPWTVHCRNGDVLPLAAWAITLGGHVSIGLGDHPYSRFGTPRNSDLVAKVAEMARTLGRPVATPRQAREILGLT